MEILKVKDSEFELHLQDGEWYSIDEDRLIKKDSQGLFTTLAIYQLENPASCHIDNIESKPYFNVAIGYIKSEQIDQDKNNSYLESLGWTYDYEKKQIFMDEDFAIDTDWSEYLIADMHLNECDAGNITITECKTFNEVLVLIKNEIGLNLEELN